MLEEIYKQVFDEINISEECLRKVKTMNTSEKRVRKVHLRYAVVAMLLLLVFVTGNVATYAATGKTIPQHVHVMLMKDGEKKEIQTTENGSFHYKDENMTVDGSTNEGICVEENLNMDANVNADDQELEITVEEEK